MHALPSPTPLQSKDSAVWPSALFLLVLASIYAIAWRTALTLGSSPDIDLLSWAFAVDLILLVPLLVYFVGVRRLGWPATTPLPAFVLGLLAAKAILPAARDGVLADLQWLIIPLEGGLMIFILWRVFSLTAQLRTVHQTAQTQAHLDLREVLERSAADVLGQGRLAGVLASEMAVFGYALGQRQAPPELDHAFSVHRRSGIDLLMGGALVATAAEIVPVHWLLHHFVGAPAAWVLTALSLYGGLWLVGHWRAVKRRYIVLDDDGLTLRQGLLWDLHVPWAQMDSLRRVPATEGHVDGAFPMNVAGLPSHCLQLSSPAIAMGPYGLRKSVQSVTFFVDDPARFDAAWEARRPSDFENHQDTAP